MPIPTIVSVSPRCVSAPSTPSVKAVARASAHRSTARSTVTTPRSRRIIQANRPTTVPVTTMPIRAAVSTSPVAVAGSNLERRKFRASDGSGAFAPIDSDALRAGSALGQWRTTR
jgi:hypothetical protein